MKPGKKKYASSTDVARLAGVSQSAVSRTCRPGASVSVETRRKVLEAMDQLNYRPSLIPQIMLSHRSNLIAIVIGGMYNPFYSAILEQFTVKLQAAGYQVLLLHVESGYSLDTVIPRLASYRVDAVVSALAVLSTKSAEELARFKIPVISFNTPEKNKWVSSVCCDNFGAASQMADLFLERGGRRFGYISGPVDSPANQDRFAGFRERLAQRGIEEIAAATADFRYEGGFQATREMFSGSDRPDAVFCANDLLAMGAVDALRKEFGLRAPEDVLIAGFDDIDAASWAAYDLTTVRQDVPRMVDEALSILQTSTLAHAPVSEVRTVIPAQLVERSTTRR